VSLDLKKGRREGRKAGNRERREKRNMFQRDHPITFSIFIILPFPLPI